MSYDADATWWKNRANRAAEQVDNLQAEVAHLTAQLAKPCGSCHPCDNWRDETWRREGRKPPHTIDWDEAQATIARVQELRDTCEVQANPVTGDVEAYVIPRNDLDKALDGEVWS